MPTGSQQWRPAWVPLKQLATPCWGALKNGSWAAKVFLETEVGTPLCGLLTVPSESSAH